MTLPEDWKFYLLCVLAAIAGWFGPDLVHWHHPETIRGAQGAIL